MSETCRILCSECSCKYYGDCSGYYGICEHPKAQNLPVYSGIDRQMMSGCNLYEKKDIPVTDLSEVEVTLNVEVAESC